LGGYVVIKYIYVEDKRIYLVQTDNESGDMNMQKKENDNRGRKMKMFLISILFIGMIVLLLMLYRTVGIFDSSQTKGQGIIMSVLLPTILCLCILLFKKIIKK